ncbi:MAG: NOL1/NOP2/sun family putative RNA methylase [Candidatus Woesearchaeota archaeon]
MQEEIKEMPWASELRQKIKPDFEKRYRNLLGEDYEAFLKFSFSFQRESFRINSLKVPENRTNEILNRMKRNFKLERIPWYERGYFYVGERRDIGNTLEHLLGYIYVQEAASMIPPLVLNPSEEDKVLDVAAAPGSKTTLLAELMRNRGVIVANDPDYSRIKALGINVQRVGALNVVITNQDGLSIRENFSKILLDAPCSGTGTIRKSPSTVEIYNVNMIKRLSNLQKKLIEHSFEILDKEGVLVYSTCTMEPEEDEAVINHLLKRHENAEIEKIRLEAKSSNPILNFEGEYFDDRIQDCLRIWPQDNNTDGFFVAKIRKL